jgi:hypothetical protein
MTEYFPSSIRAPYALVPVDLADVVKTQFHSGHSQTRAANTGIPKRFALSWYLPVDQYLDFVEFCRARHGAAQEFFWQWPFDGYGLPGYGGIGQEEDPTGFDTHPLAAVVPIGEGPYFLVKFVDLPTYRLDLQTKWWFVDATIEEQEM